MIDVAGQISAVRREVGGRVLEAGKVRVVTVSRSYPAELAGVWGACTNPERIPRWFLPVSGELKEGGRYQLEGNAGGTVTRCDPPHGFDATWEMGGEMSRIELWLAGEGNGRTRFRLDHIAHVDDERRAQFGPGAAGVGWDSALIGLYLHLTTRQAADPAKMAEWSASADGYRFLTASSDAWYEASVAFGTGPAQPRAAADRTTSGMVGATTATAAPADRPLRFPHHGHRVATITAIRPGTGPPARTGLPLWSRSPALRSWWTSSTPSAPTSATTITIMVLFCWEDGRPPHPDMITRRFKRLAEHAGLPLIDLHGVRHSYATAGRDAKTDWKALSQRTGHADVAFTMRHTSSPTL